jgi:hypothetical protein
MNQAEARSRFLSLAQGKFPVMTLEEAKNKFRKTAADLDAAIGLDGVKLKWESGLALISGFVKSTTAHAWLFPFINSLIRIGSKTIGIVLSMVTHKPKSRRRTKKRGR